MKTDPGARVWVVRNEDATTIYAYGFGTYLGDFPRPGWDHPSMLALATATIEKADTEPRLIDPHVYYGGLVKAGELTRERADAEIARVEAADVEEKARPIADRARDLALSVGKNPQIRLDSGAIVWGCECWWGEADDDTPAKWAKGRRIVEVAP